MAVVQTLIGNVKGPQGATGATGATGAKGDAATITVGSVSTTAYGNAARVENVGTENDAILNFTIPQGAPGQRTTTMSGLTLDTVTTSAEEFPVPAVGENGATVWGKVIKWFQDGLAAITAKLDANKVVNSQAVTEAGYALDAQQANPNVSGSLAAQISDLNDSLTYKSGDQLVLSFGSAPVTVAGRLGWKRGRAVFTIPLDKPITHLTSVTIPNNTAYAVYVGNDWRSCTVTSVYSFGFTHNFLCIIADITPSTAWGATTDSIANIMMAGTITINF